jgi:hypothetical protein
MRIESRPLLEIHPYDTPVARPRLSFGSGGPQPNEKLLLVGGSPPSDDE